MRPITITDIAMPVPGVEVVVTVPPGARHIRLATRGGTAFLLSDRNGGTQPSSTNFLTLPGAGVTFDDVPFLDAGPTATQLFARCPLLAGEVLETAIW